MKRKQKEFLPESLGFPKKHINYEEFREEHVELYKALQENFKYYKKLKRAAIAYLVLGIILAILGLILFLVDFIPNINMFKDSQYYFFNPTDESWLVFGLCTLSIFIEVGSLVFFFAALTLATRRRHYAKHITLYGKDIDIETRTIQLLNRLIEDDKEVEVEIIHDGNKEEEPDKEFDVEAEVVPELQIEYKKKDNLFKKLFKKIKEFFKKIFSKKK